MYEHFYKNYEDAMNDFFGDNTVTKILVYKLDNDNSRADSPENGVLPYDIAETHKAFRKILEILRMDEKQYVSLFKSIGIKE